jgi:hypothetical protein
MPHELLYLLLGWCLGLLGPRVIDTIKAHYDRQKLALAIRAEAQDLQYRVAASSFLIAQRFGCVTREYLTWIKPKLVAYAGNEPSDYVKTFVEMLLEASEEQLAGIAERTRANPGEGLSLKVFAANLVDSSLASIHEFSPEYQRLIHEFRNHLSITNQEIERAQEQLHMTFDSSMSEANHARLIVDLTARYKNIEGMCRRLCDRLDPLITYASKRI